MTIDQLAALLPGIHRSTLFRWFASGLLRTALDERGHRYVPPDEIALAKIAAALLKTGMTKPSAFIAHLREAPPAERDDLLREAVVYASGSRYEIAPCAEAVPISSRASRITLVAELL